MSWNVWSRPSGRFMVDMVISSNIMKSPSPKCYMTFWDLTIYNDTLNWSDITPICEFITELDFNTDFDLIPNFGGFHRTLQRVRLANRGRLLLQTPGPVPFGTCICSNVKTILSWTCHVYGPFEFRTSLGTSILLKDTNTKMSNAKKKQQMHRDFDKEITLLHQYQTKGWPGDQRKIKTILKHYQGSQNITQGDIRSNKNICHWITLKQD